MSQLSPVSQVKLPYKLPTLARSTFVVMMLPLAAFEAIYILVPLPMVILGALLRQF